MQYHVYLFDFDGTMVDSRESLVPVFQAGYSRVGRKVTAEEAERWMHVSLPESFEDSGVDPDKYQLVLDGILEALDLPEVLAKIKLFPEALETFARLKKQGAKIGIVSNNTALHIRNTLEAMGVDFPFDVIVGSDMFKNGKPSAEPLEVAMDILDFHDRTKVVYIGDSLQDPQCGYNASCGGILVDRENVYPDFKGIRVRDLTEIH